MKTKSKPRSKKPRKVKPWKTMTRDQRELDIRDFMARSAYWV